MDSKIETAIEQLAVKSSTAISAAEAMNFAQAALNLAHTAQVMQTTKNNPPKE